MAKFQAYNHAFAPAGSDRLGALVDRLFFTVIRGVHKRRNIARLRGLSPEQLDDIGIVPGDIGHYSRKWAEYEATDRLR